MATIGSRQEAKQRTRAALVEAGAKLFAARGLDAPSLDAICEEAGYTRGAFYVHFADRDDFLVAVMEHVGGPVLDALFSDEQQEDLPTVAQRFVTAFADGSYPLGVGGGVKPHQLLDACARSERIRALYVQLIGEAIERLAASLECTADGIRRDIPPREIATLLLALVIGAQTMLELGAPLDLERATAATLILLRG
jgi:TetR/AcrR family transcriptional regulator, transcriptional repressor for nem operon